MDEDQNNINLLPDDLRDREDKIRVSGSANIPVNFHIPEKPKEESKAAVPKPLPPAPPLSLPPKITAKNPVPENRTPVMPDKKSKQNVRPVKTKKGPGFLAKLFSKRKSELPFESNQSAVPLAELNTGSGLPPSRPAGSGNQVAKPEAEMEEAAAFTGEMDVNLIPADTYLMSSRKMLNSFIVSIIIGVIIGLLPYGGLIVYHQLLKRQSDQLQVELEQGEENFNRYKALETEAEQLVTKINAAKVIIERHVYWTKVLQILEKLTTPDVYYKNLMANINGVITISAVATDYTAVAKQYLVFQQAVNEIAKVKITGAQGDAVAANVTFSIILEMKPEVFYNLSKG